MIKVTLCNYDKLESIIDADFRIQDCFGSVNTYELWVPTCFIKFDYKYREEDDFGPIRSSRSHHGSSRAHSRAQFERIKIRPDEQFNSYYHALEAGLPLANKSENNFSYETSAWLYG